MDVAIKAIANVLGTHNELENDESYAHITVFHPVSQSVIDIRNSRLSTNSPSRVMMPDLRKLRESVKPSKTDRGDGLWP